MCLWDLQGEVPAVRQVALVEGGESPTPLELEEALPLEALLAPLATCKGQIGAALDLLQPHSFPGALACIWMDGFGRFCTRNPVVVGMNVSM